MGEENITASSSCSETKQVDELPESSCQGTCNLEETVELISSLITLSHSVKVFTCKWQSIRDKLEELLSSLTAVENCDSGDNPSIIGALNSITATLKNCDELAHRCVELSYSGKLLMQSDLDIVCARLNSDLKNLSGIYNLGLLNHKYAIVLSRPSLGASREDMKIYVKDLFSRLKVGSADMKMQALLAFNEVIQEGDKYVKIALEIDGFIVLLVNFLYLHENEIREEAAKAVSLIAGYETYKGVLIGAGIIAPLIRVLECGTESSKEFAARCLQKLTENSENAWSISAHGGVTSLLKICTNVDSGGELICLACGVLKNLVGVEEIKRFLVEEGGIAAFIRLAGSSDGVIQICSIDFLQSMASGNDSIREIIVREGGVQTLVRVLDPKSLFPWKAREMALKGIMSLCSNYTNSSAETTMLYNCGFLIHILHFLGQSEVSSQELGLKAAFWLSGISEEAKKAMGDAGYMQELMKFLDSSSFDVREMAAETLYSMIMVPRNRKKFVQNEENVGIVLQMVDKELLLEVNSGNKKLLISLLMSLTSCNSARKKIMNSGYLKKIEKLAETDNSDAKKIVKKLSSNRFRSFLNGLIWYQ